jgi:trimeric autotransporter adhesin
MGWSALSSNTTANDNSAFGSRALSNNSAGERNTAVGVFALNLLTAGGGNTALGAFAGSSLASGSNNIYIGNDGASSESNTIRIGSGSQTATYVAGVSGATSAGGVGVYVNSNHQLGTATSSRRYKEEIVDMSAESDVLLKLRPVSFYYQPDLDETRLRQYGLVAEEVAEVAPGLVAYDEDGSPQAVRYHFVNAMLLNEVQQQRRRIEAQDGQLQAQQAVIDELKEQFARLEARVP